MKEASCGIANNIGIDNKNPLSLKSLNHISLQCQSVEDSVEFYHKVLGFIPIRRPGSFDFEGAWLFNYGIGIHLIQSEGLMNCSTRAGRHIINPKDDHFSFLCESVAAVEKQLEEMKIEYVKGRVEEGGIIVEQLFVHDPDGSMIEICNCDSLPVVPLITRNSNSSVICYIATWENNTPTIIN